VKPTAPTATGPGEPGGGVRTIMPGKFWKSTRLLQNCDGQEFQAAGGGFPVEDKAAFNSKLATRDPKLL
jgi:hypothetical protein